MVVNVIEDYVQVVDKWKILFVWFLEKIVEIECRIVLEKEFNESFEEVFSWVDSVEKEILFVLEYV